MSKKIFDGFARPKQNWSKLPHVLTSSMLERDPVACIGIIRDALNCANAEEEKL